MNLGAKVNKKTEKATLFFSFFCLLFKVYSSCVPAVALFLRDILEGLLQQLPEGLDGLDEGALRGGMGRLHRGT